MELRIEALTRANPPPPDDRGVVTVSEVVDTPESLHYLATHGEEAWLNSRFNPIALCA